jgi:hypothetical protein
LLDVALAFSALLVAVFLVLRLVGREPANMLLIAFQVLTEGQPQIFDLGVVDVELHLGSLCVAFSGSRPPDSYSRNATQRHGERRIIRIKTSALSISSFLCSEDFIVLPYWHAVRETGQGRSWAAALSFFFCVLRW